MNNLQQILEMWKKDGVIDEVNLDETSRDSAKLHGKYLELLSVNRMKLKKAELDFKVVLRDKWLHYNGKMPKETTADLGQEYALPGEEVEDAGGVLRRKTYKPSTPSLSWTVRLGN